MHEAATATREERWEWHARQTEEKLSRAAEVLDHWVARLRHGLVHDEEAFEALHYETTTVLCCAGNAVFDWQEEMVEA